MSRYLAVPLFTSPRESSWRSSSLIWRSISAQKGKSDGWISELLRGISVRLSVVDQLETLEIERRRHPERLVGCTTCRRRKQPPASETPILGFPEARDEIVVLTKV